MWIYCEDFQGPSHVLLTWKPKELTYDRSVFSRISRIWHFLYQSSSTSSKGHLWWSVSDVDVEAAGGGSLVKPRVTVARGQSWRWARSYIITSRGSDLCPAAAQAELQIKAVAELGFT